MPSGLQILPLIPQNATQEQVQEAFVKAYDHLNAVIPQDAKEAMKFDVIMLEHALCKPKLWDNDRMGRQKYSGFGSCNCAIPFDILRYDRNVFAFHGFFMNIAVRN